MTRTLPVRVPPVAGESLTSWLCAYAHRNQVTWEQMLTAVGLHRRRGDMKRLGWVARLHPHEVDTLGVATSEDVATLRAMTLERFDDLGMTTGRRPPRPDFGALRGPARPLRYCPRCLVDTGGRWQLRWSVGWTFACLEHGCLLADNCPRCLRRPQRASPFARVIPDLTTCGQPEPRDGPASRCGADLRIAPDATAPATAEVLAAQRIIDHVIAGDTSDFAIYTDCSTTPVHVLADLRALAGRMQAHSKARVNAAAADGEPAATSESSPRPVAATIRDETLHIAQGYAAAVGVMASPDLESGAYKLRSSAPDARRSSRFSPHVIVGRGTTPVLTAVQLRALGPRLAAADQLRFRVGTGWPHLPWRPEARLGKLTRALPTLLWPEWAARIDEDKGNQPAVRAALSCAVAHVGTDAPTKAIAALLGIDFDASELSWHLKRLTSGPHRSRFLRNVTLLADHVATHPVVIDYHRRRRLDYSALVIEDDWGQGCYGEDHGSESGSDVDAARCALFEDLSGLPRSRAPWAVNELDVGGDGDRFTNTPIPINTRSLTRSAVKFLAVQGINDEPVTGSPPTSLVEDIGVTRA